MSTFGNMYTGDGPPPGQYEKVSAGSASWTVPAGVTSVCAVVVGAPWHPSSTPTHSTIRRGTTTLLSSGTALGSGVGGGDGGLGGAYSSRTFDVPDEPGVWNQYEYAYFAGGGGGAGGYSGDGGGGGTSWVNNNPNTAPGSGTGGSGAGGAGTKATVYGSGRNDYSTQQGYNGGGVGLRGTGPSGVGDLYGDGPPGSYNTPGQPTPGGAPRGADATVVGVGSTPPDRPSARGSNGGNLRYKNNIAVTPGEVLTLYCGTGGGLRLIWGGGRSYPSNAGNV